MMDQCLLTDLRPQGPSQKVTGNWTPNGAKVFLGGKLSLANSGFGQPSHLKLSRLAPVRRKDPDKDEGRNRLAG